MVQNYFEDQLYMAEPAFVARPGGTEEDDGVLVAAAIRGKINIQNVSNILGYFHENLKTNFVLKNRCP
jgi:hypothetical protein